MSDVEQMVEKVREALVYLNGWQEAEEALVELAERLQAAELALEWIQDFASKMDGRTGQAHTGFVHIERRARAALEQPQAGVAGSETTKEPA